VDLPTLSRLEPTTPLVRWCDECNGFEIMAWGIPMMMDPKTHELRPNLRHAEASIMQLIARWIERDPLAMNG